MSRTVSTVVLFVHPDPVVHAILTGSLGDEFTFVCVTSGREAVRFAPRHRPSVALIDVDVDDTTSAALVEELRMHDPELRAVFMAPQAAPATMWRLSSLGTVLPHRDDLERLRFALRKEAERYVTAASQRPPAAADDRAASDTVPDQSVLRKRPG